MNIIGKYVCHRLIIGISVLLWNYSIIGLIASEPESIVNRTETHKTECCGNASSQQHRIEIEYKTHIVQNEYIVRFNNYCSTHAREKHIRDALKGSKVNKKT